MGTRRSRAFRAGLVLGLNPPTTLAGWVLALDTAYPGDPDAPMELPAQAWAELVTLARAEAVGPPPPALHPAPIVLKTTSAEPVGEGERLPGAADLDAHDLVVEGLRAAPAPKKERLLKVEPDPQFDGPAEAAP